MEARNSILRSCEALGASSGQNFGDLRHARLATESIASISRGLAEARSQALTLRRESQAGLNKANEILADADALDTALAVVRDLSAAAEAAEAEAAAAAAEAAAAAKRSAKMRDNLELLGHGHIRPRGGCSKDGGIVVKADPAQDTASPANQGEENQENLENQETAQQNCSDDEGGHDDGMDDDDDVDGDSDSDSNNSDSASVYNTEDDDSDSDSDSDSDNSDSDSDSDTDSDSGSDSDSVDNMEDGDMGVSASSQL